MLTMSSRGALEAGQRYRSTGAIPAEILRPSVYRAWERSHLQGADSRTLRAEHLSSLGTLRLQEQESYLIHAARPYLRVLSQAAGGERHAVMLGDRRAIVLDVVGDDQSVQGPESVPGPGSLLSEAVGGANGLGTPLAEDSYVELVGPEHFIQGFHPFTCQGIPLRNDKHEVIGALSISVRRTEVGRRLKEILLCASHGIEAELLLKQLEVDVRRVLTCHPEDGKPLEDLRQDIVQAYAGARLSIEVSSRLVAGNRFEYALQLLKQAESAIQLFQHRATLWQDLASLEVGTIQSVSLTNTVCDLVELLATEATIRKIEIVISCQEPVQVEADPRSLARSLLQHFLQAFDRVGPGGAVQVEVYQRLDTQLAQVCLTPIPDLNQAPSMPTPFFLNLPLYKNSLCTTTVPLRAEY